MYKVQFKGEKWQPSKIVCVGRNYREHIEELHNDFPKDMVLFSKPNASIGEEIQAYHGNENLHYEGEICFLVEKGVWAGVGFGLDLTKRSLQSKLKQKGLPWERSKAFFGSALFSDFVEFSGDVADLSLQLNVNGTPRQKGSVREMIYSPQQILREITSFLPLFDGDIVMTGTPAGVGRILPGELFSGTIFERGKPLVNKTWNVKRS